MLCRKMEVWQTSGTSTMAASSVIRSLCRLTCKNLMLPTTKLDQSRIRRKQVIYSVAELAAAPLEWKVDEVRKLASVSTAATGSNTPGVAVGPRQFIVGQLLAKFKLCTSVLSCARTRRQILVSCVKLLVTGRITHILRVHSHTILTEKRAEIYDEVGQRFLERLVPGFTDSSEQATFSAGQSGIARVQHTFQTAHPGHDSGCRLKQPPA